MPDLDTIAKEIRPIRRVEFLQMAELGLFEDERVELLDGVLVAMSPMGNPHAVAVARLTELLVLAINKRAWVRPQLPFAASDVSQPEPDLAVVARKQEPGDHPDNALLAIEVAESSLAKDRGIKARIYARSGIPEYWIVNLADAVIEVRTDPTPEGYATKASYGPGAQLTLGAFPDITIAVDDVLKQGWGD